MIAVTSNHQTVKPHNDQTANRTTTHQCRPGFVQP